MPHHLSSRAFFLLMQLKNTLAVRTILLDKLESLPYIIIISRYNPRQGLI